uniref:Uncharacterized protein n=1 Tax=Wuchereria bancrofti TaxID=6293 RepID=A0A1I8F0F5_WUCBA
MKMLTGIVLYQLVQVVLILS